MNKMTEHLCEAVERYDLGVRPVNHTLLIHSLHQRMLELEKENEELKLQLTQQPMQYLPDHIG